MTSSAGLCCAAVGACGLARSVHGQSRERRTRVDARAMVRLQGGESQLPPSAGRKGRPAAPPRRNSASQAGRHHRPHGFAFSLLLLFIATSGASPQDARHGDLLVLCRSRSTISSSLLGKSTRAPPSVFYPYVLRTVLRMYVCI